MTDPFLRIQYEGAIYHVMSRGDRRERIFLNDKDREIFLKTLDEVCGKTGWQVHALCLMGNHFHLVVETRQSDLVAGMKWFLGTYTARFNRRPFAEALPAGRSQHFGAAELPRIAAICWEKFSSIFADVDYERKFAFDEARLNFMSGKNSEISAIFWCFGSGEFCTTRRGGAAEQRGQTKEVKKGSKEFVENGRGLSAN